MTTHQTKSLALMNIRASCIVDTMPAIRRRVFSRSQTYSTVSVNSTRWRKTRYSRKGTTGRSTAQFWRCCTARSKLLTSLCRSQSHPAQYVSGIPSAVILLSISHPIRCSTRCLANVRARISGPMIAL